MVLLVVLLGVFAFLVTATGAAEITLYLLYSQNRGFQKFIRRTLNVLVLSFYAIPSALGRRWAMFLRICNPIGNFIWYLF